MCNKYGVKLKTCKSDIIYLDFYLKIFRNLVTGLNLESMFVWNEQLFTGALKILTLNLIKQAFLWSPQKIQIFRQLLILGF